MEQFCPKNEEEENLKKWKNILKKIETGQKFDLTKIWVF